MNGMTPAEAYSDAYERSRQVMALMSNGRDLSAALQPFADAVKRLQDLLGSGVAFLPPEQATSEPVAVSLLGGVLKTAIAYQEAYSPPRPERS